MKIRLRKARYGFCWLVGFYHVWTPHKPFCHTYGKATGQIIPNYWYK